jgi:hypothetical protein
MIEDNGETEREIKQEIRPSYTTDFRVFKSNFEATGMTCGEWIDKMNGKKELIYRTIHENKEETKEEIKEEVFDPSDLHILIPGNIVQYNGKDNSFGKIEKNNIWLCITKNFFDGIKLNKIYKNKQNESTQVIEENIFSEIYKNFIVLVFDGIKFISITKIDYFKIEDISMLINWIRLFKKAFRAISNISDFSADKAFFDKTEKLCDEFKIKLSEENNKRNKHDNHNIYEVYDKEIGVYSTKQYFMTTELLFFPVQMKNEGNEENEDNAEDNLCEIIINECMRKVVPTTILCPIIPIEFFWSLSYIQKIDKKIDETIKPTNDTNEIIKDKSSCPDSNIKFNLWNLMNKKMYDLSNPKNIFNQSIDILKKKYIERREEDHKKLLDIDNICMNHLLPKVIIEENGQPKKRKIEQVNKTYTIEQPLKHNKTESDCQTKPSIEGLESDKINKQCIEDSNMLIITKQRIITSLEIFTKNQGNKMTNIFQKVKDTNTFTENEKLIIYYMMSLIRFHYDLFEDIVNIAKKVETMDVVCLQQEKGKEEKEDETVIYCFKNLPKPEFNDAISQLTTKTEISKHGKYFIGICKIVHHHYYLIDYIIDSSK